MFIDEIDKIAVNKTAIKSSADASSEGVQRDLLPLIEGTTVEIKIQDKPLKVKTEHILFICAGTADVIVLEIMKQFLVLKLACELMLWLVALCVVTN